jgi:hypothetical protein
VLGSVEFGSASHSQDIQVVDHSDLSWPGLAQRSSSLDQCCSQSHPQRKREDRYRTLIAIDRSHHALYSRLKIVRPPNAQKSAMFSTSRILRRSAENALRMHTQLRVDRDAFSTPRNCRKLIMSV